MSTHRSIASLEFLPLELKEEIFDYLEASDLLNLTRTCKEINYCISVSSKLIDKFEVKISEISKGIVSKRKYTRVIVNRNVTQHILKMIQEALPHFEESVRELIIPLKFLCIMSTSESGRKFFGMCKKVEEISVHSYKWKGSGKVGDLKEYFPSLERLYFYDFNRDYLPLMPMVTTELYLENFSENFHPFQAKNAIQICRNVEKLTVNHGNSWISFRKFFTDYPNLQVLNLDNCRLSINEGFPSKSFQELKLSNCYIAGITLRADDDPEPIQIDKICIRSCFMYEYCDLFERILDTENKIKHLSLVGMTLPRRYEAMIEIISPRLESLTIEAIQYHRRF